MREWFINDFGEIKSYSGSEVNIIIPQMLYDKEVTKIGEMAFSPLNARIKEKTRESRKRIESIIIPEGFKTIYESAFADCSSLKKVEIPATVRKMRKMRTTRTTRTKRGPVMIIAKSHRVKSYRA